MAKVLRAFQMINKDGQRVVSSTYNVIDASGNITAPNARDSFYVTDPEVERAIKTIEDYVLKERLGE